MGQGSHLFVFYEGNAPARKLTLKERRDRWCEQPFPHSIIWKSHGRAHSLAGQDGGNLHPNKACPDHDGAPSSSDLLPNGLRIFNPPQIEDLGSAGSRHFQAANRRPRGNKQLIKANDFA
jgi:hypothetical protein